MFNISKYLKNYIPVLEPSLLAPISISIVGVSSASKSAFVAPENKTFNPKLKKKYMFSIHKCQKEAAHLMFELTENACKTTYR